MRTPVRHNVHPLSAGGRGVEPPTKFSKKESGLDRASTFRGGDFSQVRGGVAVLTENK